MQPPTSPMNHPAQNPQPAANSQGGPGQPKLESFYESPPEVPPQKGMYIAIGAIGAAVLLFGLGMIFRGGSEPSAASAATPSPMVEAMTEQQQLMREAMQMAREAQEMQRERMKMLQEEMQGERMPESLMEPPQ